MTQNSGIIVAVSGSVVEVKFKKLPMMFAQLLTGENNDLVLEVQGYVNEDTVRSLAMGSTQGLARGMTVLDTGHQIEVPVGEATLGRMFNVLGNAIDGKGKVKSKKIPPYSC